MMSVHASSWEDSLLNKKAGSLAGTAASLLIASGAVCFGDDAACAAIAAANRVTGKSDFTTTSKATGAVIFSAIAPIHIDSTVQTCKFVRNDSSGGEAVAVYSQHMVAPAGTLDEEVWISKQGDRFVKEEIDVKTAAKGQGHLTMIYHYK